MRVNRRAMLVGLAVTPLLPRAAAAVPESQLVDVRWRSFGDRASVDHSAFTTFIQRYRSLGSDGVARVDYAAVSAEDRATLPAYLAALQTVSATELTREAAFAYWVNLYNALTLDLVLEAYPVGSIREVRGGLFNTGPWTDKVAEVDGRAISLDDIEHGVLRPVFKDPRTHYAVNCASISCPNLDATAFEADGLDARLDRLAADYVNHPRGARVENGRLYVSSIYSWFREDFGGDDPSVIAHLKRYAKPGLASQLEPLTEVWDHEYDWSLNDVG